jgi:Rab-GTPase-TBC domain
MNRDKIGDRSQLHYKNSVDEKGSVFYNACHLKITKIIKAYAILDPDVGYCPGYNYTVALLLRFIEDEEMAFWCFVGLMKLLDWRKFFILENPFFNNLPGIVEKML